MPKSIVEVAGFPVGGDQAYIIADVGSNHKQDLTLAKESIDAAAEAGANAVKFQSIDLHRLYTRPDAQTAEFIKKLEFPEEWHGILSEYCAKKGVVFFSSPTYMKAVDLLEEIDVPLYKLASAQIGTFPQIVERVAELNKPTIFSTGIANYDEVTKAVRIFEQAGNDNYIILHCNSIYPAPADRVNMPLMDTYKSMFDCPVGFSDHTNGIHIPIAAVVRGAQVIEKHFTLDKEFDTPDSTSFAADPPEFKALVEQIREVEQSLIKRAPRLDIQKEEKNFKNAILYRARLKKEVKAGDEILYSDLDYSRFTEGIDCRYAFENRNFGYAKIDLQAATILKHEYLTKE
ncbi:MAG TPA: NeuB family protein [Flavobacteriales bacterium]|nr:NeuB family protein [Flavobacteriales bacterium]